MPPRDQSHSRNPEPDGPRRENYGCRRGRPASDKLTSTEEFTKKNLELSHRKLVLYLFVVFLDSNGTLQTMYDAIVQKFGDVKDHWAEGKTRQDLTEYCARYIGAGAYRVVPWEKIEDAAWATLPEETATWVLTYAAGLYNKVRPGRPDNRKDGYTGKSEVPTWAESDTPVEFDTIADWLACHKPPLILPSTVLADTSEHELSGAAPADVQSEVAVPARPGRNGLDAGVVLAKLAAVVAQLERVERERDEFRDELEARRTADAAQEELRLTEEKQRALIASLTRTIHRLVHWSEGKQPLEHTPLDGVSTAEVKRRYEEAQRKAEALRQEYAQLANAGDQDGELPPGPSPDVDVA